MSRIFVPGGLPSHTYVNRTTFALEDRLRGASDHLCKLVTITGATKSGKTVLTQTLHPRDKAIWLDGGAFHDEDAIWNEIVQQLNQFTETATETGGGTSVGAEGAVSGDVGLFTKVGGSASANIAHERTSQDRRGRSLPAKNVALAAIQEAEIPLVIDDFHYLDKDLQAAVVRALKAPIFNGVLVIFIAIPHRRYDVVRVEKEMAGRIESIAIPEWTTDELMAIPRSGFPLLNVEVDAVVLSRFAEESLGSPHLMQDFCRGLCYAEEVVETCFNRKQILPTFAVDDVFRRTAESTSRVVFDRLAKGPRQRSDRISRRMADGTDTDIYGVVLRAIARLRPGTDTLDYETVRASLREVLTGDLPQAHEVSRVFEQMAKITAADEASVPVIDWQAEDRLLHITDPFFAFFLRWGEIPR